MRGHLSLEFLARQNDLLEFRFPGASQISLAKNQHKFREFNDQGRPYLLTLDSEVGRVAAIEFRPAFQGWQSLSERGLVASATLELGRR